MATLDTASIRSSNEREVAQYLRELAEEGDVENTTQQLIDAVERGSIPPSTLKIWLSISHSPAVLKQALEQDISVRIRKIAIEQLEKLLRSRKWRDTWNGLGAVEGFMSLFRSLSASDVQDACRAIGSSTKGADSEKRAVITDLFKALENQTLDTRPLIECYQYLLPGSAKDHIAEIVDAEMQEGNHRQKDLLLRNHADVLRDNFLKMVLDYDGPNRPWLFALMREYPAAPGTKANLSSTMEFSLEVLRKLVKDDQVPQISDEAFVFEISEPLLLRCLKKTVATRTLQEVVDLITEYIKRHPSVASIINVPMLCWGPAAVSSKNKKTFVEKIVESWLQTPEIFGNLFRLLLAEATPSRYGRGVEFDAFNFLITKFDSKDRYKLFKFCIQFSTIKEDEVEVDFDEGLSRTTGTLMSHSIPNLNAEETLDLFLRLRRVRGDEIAGSIYIGTKYRTDCDFFSLTKEKVSEHNPSAPIDLDLWQVHFLQRASQQEEAESLAKLRISERKKAQSTPNESLRGLHARGVLLYAIASGSVSILGEVVNWTRRLIRDPNINLFCDVPSEIYGVLSGLPLSIGKDASLLRKGIKHANRIMSDIFDIVCSGLKDPAFRISMWRDDFEYFHQAAFERANRSNELKENFSDEEIYSILWEDTVRLLLDIEQKVIDNQQLHDADERYHKKWIRDFTGQNTPTLEIDSNKVHPSTYRFLDTWAKERNELWRKQRILKCPEVATLSDPYPQGLPLQYLIKPFSMKHAPLLDDLVPYIASRVKAIIFPSAEQSRALISTESDIATNPLGIFVEDYRYALELYLSKNVPEQERQSRLDSTWAYAIGPLSEGRMSTEQAIRYWQDSFTDALYMKKEDDGGFVRSQSEFIDDKNETEEHKRIREADLKWLQSLSTGTKPDPLRIPAFDSGTSILEWDAIPDKDEIKAHALGELTYIDVSTNPYTRYLLENYSKSGKKHFLETILAPAAPGKTYQHNTWTRAGNQKAKSAFQLQEAQVLSALLYLQTKTLVSDQLLTSPFPSTDDIRYPSIHLSTACLSKLSTEETNADLPKTLKGLSSNTKAAFKALEAQISFVPPALILKLTENAFSSLNSMNQEDLETELPALESLAFNLLRVLARSDRPRLALELAIQSISKYPESVFWYKRIFTIGFFRDLTPYDANEGISKFAETVFTLLNQMEQAKKTKKAKAVDEKPSTEATDSRAKGQDSRTEDPGPPAEKPKSESSKDETGFVKVSTIKLLIELFEDGDFLPKASPLSNIHTLCKKSSNLDIHKTVIYYLIRVVKSPQPLEAEFFSILSTLVAKSSETDIYKLILEMFNFSLKSSKLNSENQPLAISVISSIYKKATDIEIAKQIIKYFTVALDTPLSSDTAVQVLFLSMVSKMSNGDLDSKLRDALVVYLLCLLKISTPEGYDQILDILEELVADCGNVNETEPVTEAQWIKFEEAIELPDCHLWNTVANNNNPILLRLVEFHKDSRKMLGLNVVFTERIMIPIIKKLNSQSSRYFSILLQQNGINKTDQKTFELPPASKTIDLIKTVIQNGFGQDIIPLIHEYVSYAIFNINPPGVLEGLNKRCNDDKNFRGLNSTKNWWHSYDMGTGVSQKTNLISLIRARVEASDKETIGACIREQFLKVYKATFWREAKDLDFKDSNYLLDMLEPKPLDATWLKYIHPILEDTVQFLNSLHTTEWEQNLDREPQILPDTFRSQIWLLNIPSRQRNDQDQQTRCRVFAEELIKMINDISTSCEFISRVSTLKEVLKLARNDAEDDLVVASLLGDLANIKSSSMAIQDYTRIEIASTMLHGRNITKNTSIKETTDGMIQSWKMCQTEGVRRFGYSAESLELRIPSEEPPKAAEVKRKPRCVQQRPGRRARTSEMESRWGLPNLQPYKTTRPAPQQHAKRGRGRGRLR
ncbi:uncharacterized protein DFL_007650 [Arthrobotrys flagrans]|uniref:Uncharacterized protein n=1 Tax=Arthrobotrys flagrans TaxID=97331 RepID=A0A436ZX02_ARTFL|nr:hypothetical protein DFL_007650 [Arthrobotrys flagrans]